MVIPYVSVTRHWPEFSPTAVRRSIHSFSSQGWWESRKSVPLSTEVKKNLKGSQKPSQMQSRQEGQKQPEQRGHLVLLIPTPEVCRGAYEMVNCLCECWSFTVCLKNCKLWYLSSFIYFLVNTRNHHIRGAAISQLHAP